jgi:hypothetical protein
MEKYKHKQNGNVVTVKRTEGKFLITHPDGNKTLITEHKLNKRYELLSKTNNSQSA